MIKNSNKKCIFAHVYLAFCAIIFMAFSFFAQSQDQVIRKDIAEPRINVFELFTSQGCSSCPPADAYLAELARNPKNITLACHVTYWDYLGWKDSFSHSFCDRRQYMYKRYLKTRTAYTPQIIINGRYEGVGSQRSRVQSLINKSENDEPLLSIRVKQNATSLQIDLSALKNMRTMELYILGLGASEVVDINKGENRQRSIEYHNPVIFSRLVSMDSDTANRIREDVSAATDVVTWVVLAQDIRTGVILAAGRTSPEVAAEKVPDMSKGTTLFMY